DLADVGHRDRELAVRGDQLDPLVEQGELDHAVVDELDVEDRLARAGRLAGVLRPGDVGGQREDQGAGGEGTRENGGHAGPPWKVRGGPSHPASVPPAPRPLTRQRGEVTIGAASDYQRLRTPGPFLPCRNRPPAES